MENNDGGSPIADNYMTSSGQYLVHAEEGDDSLGGGIDSEGGGDCSKDSLLREQVLKDRFLPIANVARIMKKAIPKSGKIAKDARECVQECVSEFISFITSEASDRCHQEKRKTINGEDILFAMSTLGFDNYVEPLKLYLQKYRDSMKGDRPVGGGGSDSQMEEIGEDSFSTQALVGNVLTTEPSGQANVIYAYPTQLAQQIHFT